MSKKILIIGNSAKAHSLAKKLSENNEVFIVPSKDLDIREDSSSELLEFVMGNGIDLTIPLSKTALESDIVQLFNNNNQQVFAPSQAAAQLVFDKALAKKVLYKLRIPTPKFGIFEKQNLVIDYTKNLKNPFVLKTSEASSATAFTSYNTAKNIIDSLFINKNQKVIIEDYIYGTPFSFYTITDGYKALPIGSSIVYRHLLEGDGGQLTSGMGACAPNYKLSIEQEYYLMDNVIYPTLDYLEIGGNPYLGILGVNGILTEDGKIVVLGYQNFTQDCDTDAVFEILDTDLYSLMESCVIGSFSDEVEFINQKEMAAASLVLTCRNNENFQNAVIGLDNLDEDTKVTFYPNIIKNKYLEYEAQKGPVLVLTSTGKTTNSAVNNVYNEAECIKFNGLYYRKDICKEILTFC